MEYKFRAKRKDNNYWVYGYLASPNSINAEVIDNSTGFSTFDEYTILPETIGQYTNRLDNYLMSDIYQGDILQSANGKMWEVVFRNYGWAISNKRIKDNGKNKFGGYEEYSFQEYIRICKEAKVEPFKKIGNIHDHPQLIENQ
jgi:hypothetical protein